MQELLCIKINSVKNLFQFSISYLSPKTKKKKKKIDIKDMTKLNCV